MSYSIAHVGINVLELERSLRFYADAFGMKEVFRLYPRSDVNMILCFLTAPDDEMMLTLTYHRDWKLPYDSAPDTGHIAIITDDFEGSYKKHSEMGIVTVEGLDKLVYFVEDPDGHEIAVTKDSCHPRHVLMREPK